MKQFIGIAASLMAILMVNGMAAWTLNIESSKFNKTNVTVEADFLFCKNDTFLLAPGGKKSIRAGFCKLENVSVAQEGKTGVAMHFDNNPFTNPVDGLGIITINKREKDADGKSLERYKVVSLAEMRADDEKEQRFRDDVLKAVNDAKRQFREDLEKDAREAFGD
jgi:hypothetical protein